MSLLQHFVQGGSFMFVILAFALFTIGLIIERATTLYFKIKAPQQGFRQQILTFLNRGDFVGAEQYAMSTAGSTALGRVVASGCRVRANFGGEEEVQARMDERLSSEIHSIDQRTGFLAMLGNVATLSGLLGTIVGMITSFAAVSKANPVDRATMLSQGISEAMNCTAFGLMVAIPALVAYAIFQNKTDRMVSELTESATEIYHDILFMTESADAELGKHLGKGVPSSSTKTSPIVQPTPPMSV